MPNQDLSDQRQTIWIGRLCFPMWNKALFMQAKWMLWKLVLWNPQILNPFDQSNITSLDQKQYKNFSTLMQTYPWESLKVFRISLFWTNIKMIFFGIALKFQKFFVKTTLCKQPNLLPYSLIPKENPIWTLGDMIKLWGNPPKHIRPTPWFPF